jgi:hypothetical protein
VKNSMAKAAFVHSSEANQAMLDDYVKKFRERSHYQRMIFAVHSPRGTITPPKDGSVQVWEGDRLAQLVMRLGLGEWVERKLA